MVVSLALLALSLAADVSPLSKPGPQVEIPADLKAKVELAEQLGREIYVHDQVSALGTDVLLEHIGSFEGKNLGGYLTFREGDDDGRPTGTWLVSFYGTGDDPKVLYRIRVQGDGSKPPEFLAPQPPESATPPERWLIRIRQAALDAAGPFSQPINPIILPAEVLGETGTLVLLLAATSEPGVAVFGRHVRVFVTQEGKVAKVEPLSNAALELPTRGSDGKPVAALGVTHVLTDYPLETHVFTQLLTRIPVYVRTNRGLWCVDEGKIAYLGAATPDAGEAAGAK